MGNCLVTKLKEVVDNDKLTKLGELRFSVKTDSDISFSPGNKFWFNNYNSPATIESISNGGKVYNSAGQEVSLPTSITNVKYIYAPDGAVVSIMGKYDISQIDIKQLAGKLDVNAMPLECIRIRDCQTADFSINQFTKEHNLEEINIPNSSVTGDISSLAHMTNLTKLHMAMSELNPGDFSTLAKCIKLTEIECANMKPLIGGDIEDLVSGMWQNERRSGTMSVQCNSGITFINEHRAHDISCVFGANSVVVTYKDSDDGEATKTATYDGTDWIYS